MDYQKALRFFHNIIYFLLIKYSYFQWLILYWKDLNNFLELYQWFFGQDQLAFQIINNYFLL